MTSINPRASHRAWAAASHLGMPFWSFLLPLFVWLLSKPDSFQRIHARQAFSFQLVWLPVGFVGTVLMIWAVEPLLLLIALGFIIELPQVARALIGRPPFRFPRFSVLEP